MIKRARSVRKSTNILNIKTEKLNSTCVIKPIKTCKKRRKQSVGDESTPKKRIKIESTKGIVHRSRTRLSKTRKRSIVQQVESPEKAIPTGCIKPNAKQVIQLPVSTKKTGHRVPPKVDVAWEDYELLAEDQNLEPAVAKNLVEMFLKEDTIPFIARYRKEKTGGMDPQSVRLAKEAFDRVQKLKTKATSVAKMASATGQLDSVFLNRIASARSIAQLEILGAPFKTESARSLAERARALGLGPPAQTLLTGSGAVNLMDLVNPEAKGLETVAKVRAGVIHIIADTMSKDSDLLTALETYKEEQLIRLECKKKQPKDDKGDNKKYDLYHDYVVPVKSLKPHQMLAINRGEAQGVLAVRVIFPERLWDRLRSYCNSRWLYAGTQCDLRSDIFAASVADAIKRLLSPMAERAVRAALKHSAEMAGIESFASNLKELLLSPPYRGKTVMAVDPGFAHGCKVAVVSSTGKPLSLTKFYLPGTRDYSDSSGHLADLLRTYSCESIAIGNGVGCRETEEYITRLITNGCFAPLNVAYTIVSEDGLSVFSCSPLAAEEFPGLDPTVISPISLARRLQDPLCELIKVEPKHLGVGMYQLDLASSKLEATLDEVVSECVSFVGVDVNTASVHLLRRVAGLTKTRAEHIVEWRLTNGPFLAREHLGSVKGIGPKTLVQCAGFLRIIPATAGGIAANVNPMDSTWIHPESYPLAKRMMQQFGVKLRDLGSASFISAVSRALQDAGGVDMVAKGLEEPATTVRLIVDAFCRPLDHDIRSLGGQSPLFRRGITTLESLQIGTTVTGVVRNVVDFGCFVDIGVGNNGLVHRSNTRGLKPILGNKVQVRVLSVDLEKKRISLALVSVSSAST